MRYNLVLVPSSKEVRAALIAIAHEASINRGLSPGYLLNDMVEPSIPHISVMQFEIKGEAPSLEVIWEHASTIWQEVLAGRTKLVCALSPTINYKHTTAGPFAGMSWAEILIDKVKNSYIQDLHDRLREKLEPLRVICLNAAGHNYNPHFTLFNIRTDLLSQADVMVDVPETYAATLGALTVRPALGIANARWELTAQLYEEKLPQPVNEARLGLGR